MMRFFFPLAHPQRKIGYAEIRVERGLEALPDWEPLPHDRFALAQVRQAFGAFFPQENGALHSWWQKKPYQEDSTHEWRGASANLACLLASAACSYPFRLSRTRVWASGLVSAEGRVSAPSMLPEKLEIVLEEASLEGAGDRSKADLKDTVFFLPASGYDDLKNSLHAQQDRVEVAFWPRDHRTLASLREPNPRSSQSKLLLIFFNEDPVQAKELIEWLQRREKRKFPWLRWLGFVGLLLLLLASLSFADQEICKGIWRPIWPNLSMDYQETCKRRVLVARTCGNICGERCRFLGRFGYPTPPCHFICEVKQLHNICQDHSAKRERCGEQEIERLAAYIDHPNLFPPLAKMDPRKSYSEKIDAYCDTAAAEVLTLQSQKGFGKKSPAPPLPLPAQRKSSQPLSQPAKEESSNRNK